MSLIHMFQFFSADWGSTPLKPISSEKKYYRKIKENPYRLQVGKELQDKNTYSSYITARA